MNKKENLNKQKKTEHIVSIPHNFKFFQLSFLFFLGSFQNNDSNNNSIFALLDACDEMKRTKKK